MLLQQYIREERRQEIYEKFKTAQLEEYKGELKFSSNINELKTLVEEWSVEVSFSSSFRRVFKKRIKGNVDLEARFWEKLEQFTKDLYNPSLKTHKLSDKLKDLWSFSVDYDERVLFYFTEDGNAVFVDFGSHDEVY